jgi:Polysaccharide deacetylase
VTCAGGAERCAAPKVPIVIYHSIADDHHHPWSFMSLPVRLFERQLRYLKRRGFTTVNLYDVYEYLKTGKTLPGKSIVLTFDDGFLDSWVHVFPLLKKYGMKGTVFVTTDFVDPSEQSRPTLEDVWSGKQSGNGLQWWGYLSWMEMRTMNESGVMDFQSHARTHTWYFNSDKIIDFHHPGDSYVWLYWNKFPEKKHAWLHHDFCAGVPWGSPVYRYDQALLTRRYFEDPALTGALVEHIECRGGIGFFDRHDWKEELFRVVEQYRSRHGSGGFCESQDEYCERVRDELNYSKKLIEEKLNKPVDFLCWPCGDFTDDLHRMAVQESGYWATVTARKRPNQYGNDPSLIDRTYFRADYRGPWRERLIYLNFCATINQQSGVRAGRWLVPLMGKGLMRLLHRAERRGA